MPVSHLLGRPWRCTETTEGDHRPRHRGFLELGSTEKIYHSQRAVLTEHLAL